MNLIKGRLVLLDDGRLTSASIEVENGIIHRVHHEFISDFHHGNYTNVVDAGYCVLMPGFIGYKGQGAAKGGFTSFAEAEFETQNEVQLSNLLPGSNQRDSAWKKLLSGNNNITLNTNQFQAEQVLPLFWSEGRRRGISLKDLSRILTGNQSRIHPGSPADFVLWDPNEVFTDSSSGQSVTGRTKRTIARGEIIYEQQDQIKHLFMERSRL